MLTDRETHRHAHHNTLPPTGGEETNRFLHALHSLELKVYHRRPEAVSDTRVTVKKQKGCITPTLVTPAVGESILKPRFCHDMLSLTEQSAAP